MAGSAVVGTLRALLSLDTADFEAATERVSNVADQWGRRMGQVGRQMSQVGQTLTAGLTVPIVGLAGVSLKAATDFESSFAGVRKTVDATEEEFDTLAQQFREMSRQIPVNVNELNRLGEAAGALGTPKEEIADFARVMAMLGVTTNLTSDQAAESIAKIQNIFGAAGKETENFASALVALGNDGASTESQIVEMAARIAGAGNVVGMSQGEVLAYASALSSLGIEAEMGGSAISRVFLTMASKVAAGGDAIKGFADVAGMSVQQFAELFEQDAAGAVNAFLSGLGNIKDSGGNLIGTLEELEFTEIRVRDTLMRAAGAGDLLTNALTLQNAAWQENTALSTEANERFKTTESQLILLKNNAMDVAMSLGQALLPFLQSVVNVVGQLVPIIEVAVGWFASMPEPIQAVVIGFGALVAAVGPLLMVAGSLASAFAAIAPWFAAGTTGAAVLGGALTVLSGPIGWVTAAVAGLAAIWLTWGDDISSVTKSTYETVKLYLWDKLEPVLTPIGELLSSLGRMFEAFGRLVGAVLGVVIDAHIEMVRTVATWLVNRLQPLFGPLGRVIEAFGTLFGRVKDAVVLTAQRLYEGVKTWMLDRFASVVDGIRSKVESVTGFFEDMYDAVVGNSFVPDMIVGITREFATLDANMVSVAKVATDSVVEAFSSASSRVGTEVQNLVAAAQGGMSGLVAYAWDFGMNFSAAVLDTLVPGLGQFVQAAWPIIQEGLKALGNLIGDFFEWAWDGIKKLWSSMHDSTDPIDSGHPRYGIERRTSGAGMTAPPDVPSFQTGTNGRYVDFGAGTLAMLHGKEKITPYGDSGGDRMQIIFQLGPDRFAEWLLPFMPGAQERLAI